MKKIYRNCATGKLLAELAKRANTQSIVRKEDANKAYSKITIFRLYSTRKSTTIWNIANKYLVDLGNKYRIPNKTVELLLEAGLL